MVNIKECMPQEKSLHTSVNCMIVPNTFGWGVGGGGVRFLLMLGKTGVLKTSLETGGMSWIITNKSIHVIRSIPAILPQLPNMSLRPISRNIYGRICDCRSSRAGTCKIR